MNFLDKLGGFAPGLPDRSRVDAIKNRPGLTRLVFQRHKATSDHYDMRVLDGDVLHSWVTRSLPGEKDKMLMVRQPTHTADYIDFEGTIASGYGAGTVTKAYDKPVEILKANENRLHFVTPEGEFHAIKTQGPNWLWIKAKNTIPNPVTEKISMKDKAAADLDFHDPETVLQPKIDGGHTIFRLSAGDKPSRLYSYRVSEKTGEVIEHTHQAPWLRDLKVPPALDGVEVRGELYAKNQLTGPLKAEAVGGLLNAGIFTSREKQAVAGKLQFYPFKVVKWKGGVDVENAPYHEHLSMIEDIAKKVKGFFAPETARTAAEKRELFNRVKTMTHPDTVEGVVEWNLQAAGGNPHKVKLRDQHEVVIRNIFPAQSKKPIAGGFEYSWTKDGPVVGRVGTGFTETERMRMLSNPEEFIGRIARVKAQAVFGSGAMRAPSYYGLHVEKNLEKAAAANLARGLDTLGIPRKDMPQIKDVNEFVDDVKDKGVKVTNATVDPDTLKPTQSYISADKVSDFDPKAVGKKPIVVSKDGRVVDGHHQWAKAVLLDKDVEVVKLDVNIDKALELAKAAFYDELNKIASARFDDTVDLDRGFTAQILPNLKTMAKDKAVPVVEDSDIIAKEKEFGKIGFLTKEAKTRWQKILEVTHKGRKKLLQNMIGGMSGGVDSLTTGPGKSSLGYGAEHMQKTLRRLINNPKSEGGLQDMRSTLRGWKKGPESVSENVKDKVIYSNDKYKHGIEYDR